MLRFLKHFGIYGIIPILSKFIGFLLIPIYTRVFNPDDFGLVEMYRSAGMFIIFFISMEIYTAVGRYFYEYESDKERNVLISTGLWFNVISSIFFVTIIIILKDFISAKLLNVENVGFTYYVVVLWLPLNAIYSYFTVMMRFEKKPKVFLMINLFQVIIRLFTIILLVVVIKIGICGIFWGNIAGEIFGIIVISIYLKKYLSFSFDRRVLSKLLLFSLPLLPGLLILGFQKPWANYIVQQNLSYSDLGLYSLGLRVVSVFTIISYGFKMAWRPYLYEQVAHGDFSRDTKKIFNFFLVGLWLASIIISLFAREIIELISTKEYISAYMVVGFLSINALLNILMQIIGIGPEIKKKTYWITITGVIRVCVIIGSLSFLLKHLGLVGIPIALMFGSLFAFIISWSLTEKMLSINFPKYTIIASILLLVTLNVILLNYEFLFWQKILFFLTISVSIGWRYNRIIRNVLLRVKFAHLDKNNNNNESL